MPDWSLPQYQWLSTRLDHCLAYDITGNYPEPSFSFRVLGSNPKDGRILLLLNYHRLATYEPRSGAVVTIVDRDARYAVWNSTGTRLMVLLIPTTTWADQIVILDEPSNSHWTVPLPDSSRAAAEIVDWLPGDTSIVANIPFYSKTPTSKPRETGFFEISINPPLKILPWKFPRSLGIASFGDRVYWMGGINFLGSINKFESFEIGWGYATDTTLMVRWNQPEIAYAERKPLISPDGRWIAVTARVNLEGTPFEHSAPSLNWLPSLCVFALTSEKTSEGKLYRVFPDHTNSMQHCSSAFTTAGFAWSPDSKGLVHEWIRMSDSTTQVAYTDLQTGKLSLLSDFHTLP